MKANKKNEVDYKKVIGTWFKHNYIYVIMVALVGFRVLLGYGIGAWFGISETYDDMAMMQGLSLKRLAAPDNLSLIKDLSFSLFLGFSAITNLPITITMSLFWALVALVVWLLARKLSKNKWVHLFVFAYVLFLPIAFTSWGGLRIYRNAIIAPSIILTFSLLLMVVVDIFRKEQSKKTIWTAIFAGLAFAFTYYLKEDGVWMMVCILFIMAICLAKIARDLIKANRKKEKSLLKRAAYFVLICVIPFGVWFVWTNVYKGFNYAVFGVYETNTRTKGELGKFVENIYLIDSPNRSNVVWAPYDAIQKAFEASPTLKAQPKLLDEIMNTGWNTGGIIENPIKYDFLGWVMRTELADAGLWTSEQAVNDMFRQVNIELKEAFNSGELKKTEGRIQLLASTGGYTWDEILGSDMLPQIRESFLDAIWLKNYRIGFGVDELAYGTKGLEWDYSKVNRVLHMSGDVNVIEGREVPKTTVEIVCVLYRVVNTGLLVIFVVFVGREIVLIIKNRKTKNYTSKHSAEIACAVTAVLFFGIMLAYSFATAWFFIAPVEDFNPASLTFVFYRVGVPGLGTMFLLSSFVGFSKMLEGKEKKKR